MSTNRRRYSIIIIHNVTKLPDRGGYTECMVSGSTIIAVASHVL